MVTAAARIANASGDPGSPLSLRMPVMLEERNDSMPFDELLIWT